MKIRAIKAFTDGLSWLNIHFIIIIIYTDRDIRRATKNDFRTSQTSSVLASGMQDSLLGSLRKPQRQRELHQSKG